MPSVQANGRPVPIDVLIPAIEKDLPNLPHVIDSLRKMVRPAVGRIYIVSPRSARLEELCRRKGCTFVNENTVLPITKKDIRYRSARWDRSGWMLQQLLKLGGDTVVKSRHFLVADADTVMIRPHVFRAEGRTVVYSRNWSQPEYFRAYRKLLGEQVSAPRSFVAHYMLFDKRWLKRLKAHLEARHGIPWYQAILKGIRTSSMFAFSEFETYGNFVYNRAPSRIRFKKTLNRHLHGTNIGHLSASKLTRLAQSYRSLSFHKRDEYYRKSR
ncbi:DUF6492 family protein [Gorillibacterium sp. sgz5001074]|uniref:DUF6492 family protein n=1 Tax=Gorillibacterium sp. sgz5001074 TaxID=3446695 RepID=UPI003F66D599